MLHWIIFISLVAALAVAAVVIWVRIGLDIREDRRHRRRAASDAQSP
ncbi:MAG TPA: hypothetical protein VH518_25540 [Tepidisphaeraceae bacterium]|jgi:hypothetical protein